MISDIQILVRHRLGMVNSIIFSEIICIKSWCLLFLVPMELESDEEDKNNEDAGINIYIIFSVYRNRNLSLLVKKDV